MDENSSIFSVYIKLIETVNINSIFKDHSSYGPKMSGSSDIMCSHPRE